jgi:hypothetical protein
MMGLQRNAVIKQITVNKVMQLGQLHNIAMHSSAPCPVLILATHLLISLFEAPNLFNVTGESARALFGEENIAFGVVFAGHHGRDIVPEIRGLLIACGYLGVC